MKALLKNSRERIEKQLLDLLAHQWSQLGGGIVDPQKRDDAYALDPEALILFTCEVGRLEMRIFDDMLDWLTINGRFVNVARLKTIAKRYSFLGTSLLAPIADVIHQHDSRIRWQIKTNGKENEQDLAVKEHKTSSSWGNPDPVFLKYGFRRGSLELRQLAGPFNRTRNAAGLLRLRSLFGSNARAEIILYLLNHQPVHPSKVARDIGYSQKTVQDTMVDMAASGWLVPIQLERRRKHYRIVHLEDWQQFLFEGRPIPKWQTWPPIFKILELIWTKICNLPTDIDEMILASEVKLLIRSLSPLLLETGKLEADDSLKSCNSFKQIADLIIQLFSWKR